MRRPAYPDAANPPSLPVCVCLLHACTSSHVNATRKHGARTCCVQGCLLGCPSMLSTGATSTHPRERCVCWHAAASGALSEVNRHPAVAECNSQSELRSTPHHTTPHKEQGYSAAPCPAQQFLKSHASNPRLQQRKARVCWQAPIPTTQHSQRCPVYTVTQDTPPAVSSKPPVQQLCCDPPQLDPN